MRRHSASGSSSTETLGGRLVGSIVFLMFAGIGGFITVMIVREALDRLRLYAWNAVPCQIVRSEVGQEEGSDRYFPVVEYTYQVGQRTYTGTRHTLTPRRYDQYSEVAAIIARFSPGSEQRCYVDPEQPVYAVLKRQSPWFGLVAMFPLLFVLIGVGGLYALWRPGGRRMAPSASNAAVKKDKSAALGVGFFALFALAGFGFLIPFFILPVIRIIGAQDWPAVPCTILHGKVRSHSDSDGTTYSIDILYEYEMDGRTYKSDRYNFMTGSSSGRRGKQDIVDIYLRAENPVCYVNPEDPSQAVLNRGPSLTMLFGLIPLVFVLVGVGGMIGVTRAARRKARRLTQADWLPETATQRACELDNEYRLAVAGPAGPVVLKAPYGRWGKLIGVIIFAAIWNGIVSVFLVIAVRGFQRGHPEWCLTLFLIPFVLVGLGTLVAVVYQFLALFNPRAKLTVATATIPLGGSVSLSWEIFGRVERIGTLTITLKGREEARYRRGTKTYTDKNTFYEEVLVSTDDSSQMAYGQTTLRIPADTMHSFRADHNKIIWSLVVRGDIARWPDVKDEYEITIAPHRLEGGRSSGPRS